MLEPSRTLIWGKKDSQRQSGEVLSENQLQNVSFDVAALFLSTMHVIEQLKKNTSKRMQYPKFSMTRTGEF